MGRPRLPWSAAFALVVTTLPLACDVTGPSETEAEFWARMEAFVTERMDPQGSGFGFATGILNYVVRVPERRFTYLFFSNGGVFANDGFDTWTNELMEEIYDYYL